MVWLVKALGLAPVRANFCSALPSLSSNILCSRKCATPAGVSYRLPSNVKEASTEPKSVARMAKVLLKPSLGR